ncbi:hemolysin family protein [Limoniibacter endophyticus]|uniref:DNA-binding protein n=1 Tax=Limoniibacter endophyticus TaxID=1565040 RepID=A0A8J3DMX9_9HYPH|nr:hemolysin family protein [Limoniibacter endophyticus]GHC65828.1 DNA-binding protein [Limoniibacter endophyticus]
MIYVEIAAVIALIIVNGVLAMSELAVVSSRQGRLKALAEKNMAGARAALELSENPGRFLSSVQIGITLVGVLSGAFSGATLGIRAGAMFTEIGLPARIAEPLGVGFVVALITYGSLIIGELVPKQLALRNPEGVACKVAPAMRMLARIGAPVVWLLDVSGRGVLKLIGAKKDTEEKVTDEEIQMLIAEAESAGVLESDERRLITGVMRLADRAVRGVMTPRTDVTWLNVDADDETIRTQLMEAGHARLPAGNGSVDEMIGVVTVREALIDLLEGKAFDREKHVRAAPVVHDQADALTVLETLKNAEIPVALVHDEYGHFEGMVTPADILEAIAGVFRSDLEEDDVAAFEREDGSWLLAGYMPADEIADLLGIELPKNRDYDTLAGFLLSHLHRLPKTGEIANINGWRFEIIDLDGRRIDKVLASRSAIPHREAQLRPLR